MHIAASGGKESKRDILAEALEKRSEFGYTDRDCKESEANLHLMMTNRFIDWDKTRTAFIEETKNRQKKGQAILLNHAIMVSFSIFMVYVVFTTFAAIKTDYQQYVGGNEIKELCFVMRGAVDKVYAPSDFNVSTNVSLGQIEVRLPERITDTKYQAKFFNKSILIESNFFNDTCKIGYAANYNGSTSGGLTRFSYSRYTNGTNVIEMTKI